MIRVYSPTGPLTLMQNVISLGGHVDCLSVDSAGGCFAILGSADAGMITIIQSLGVTVIPSNMAAAAPASIPAAAYGGVLPLPVTVDDLMRSVYSNNAVPSWHPDFV